MIAHHTSDRLHVLVVDDTELNRRLLEAMLCKMGHEVILASGGAEALAIFDANPPDLILLDVSMPLMDGFEVAKVIRRKNVWVPIFFVSARTGNDDVVQGLHAGGDDYLFKPINYEILQSKIRTFQERLAMSEKLLEKNQRLLDYRERIEAETDTAREFIKQFTALDKIKDPLVQFMLKPAENFSGDLIAVARTPDERLHVLLADSAGHGLTAALAVIPITQPFYQMTAKGFDVPAIVREINRRVRDYLPLPRFVAATMLSLNTQTQTIQVWNGGCPASLLLSPDGAEIIHRFESSHLPLGVVPPGHFDASLEYYCYADLQARLMICSDGATEITMGDGLSLDHDGLLLGAKQSASDHLFDKMVDVIDGQLKGAPPEDDIALIVVDCQQSSAIELPEEQQPFIVIEPEDTNQLCGKGKSGIHMWEVSLMLTAEQLKRLDVVPFLLNITGQIDGGNASGKVFLVLSELFNNALDHGLLKLNSALKNDLDGMEKYLEERADRLKGLEYGYISLRLEKQACEQCNCLKIYFKDSGDGFDYSSKEVSGLTHQKRHGRGIALLNTMCNALHYYGNGSEVVAYLPYTK